MDGSQEELLVGRADGVLRLTLNRSAAANAVTAEMREAMISALQAAGVDADVRAVVIAAAGRHFCSGADVANIKPATRAGEGMTRIMAGAQRLIAAILDCPKPIVAAVQGTAAGLGAHLAFACDLVVAAEEAAFIEVFVKRGISVDAGGAWLLTRMVGMQKAKELVYLGDRVSAAEAAAMGLVNRVVSGAELAEATAGLASRLAAGPTLAISLAKRQLNVAFESDRATAFLAEAMAQEIASRSKDAAEGIQSFVERREPRFKGF